MAAFDPSRRRLWCHGLKPEYLADSDAADYLYMPARTLPLVRPDKDMIVLPSGSAALEAFAEFCCAVLGLRQYQILWVADRGRCLLDHQIREELGNKLGFTLTSSWELVPYAATAPFMQWAREVSTGAICGDAPDWVERYGNKGMLYPHIRRPDHGYVTFDLPDGITIARGYVCDTGDDLLAASASLQAQGVASFVIKPIAGATGQGIEFVRSRDTLATYTFPLGPVVFEEELSVNRDAQGLVAPSVQFMGHTILNATNQLLDGCVYQGNTPLQLDYAVHARLYQATKAVLNKLEPTGPGGLDFLAVGNQLYLSDPNLGRFTAAHPASIFRKLYRGSPYAACWKVAARCDVKSFWYRLQQRKIAFDPCRGGKGVFPLCYLPGVWSMLVAYASNPDDLTRLRSLAEECL